jgi:hypothetical protein
VKIVETKPAPADELADAERTRAYQRDVAAASRLIEEVVWLAFAARCDETPQ